MDDTHEPDDGSDADAVALARRLVGAAGGRFSAEAGIDVDAGADEVERWFLAATLFGTRISAATAIRTYRVLAGAGVATIRDAGGRTWDELVDLLDRGGYARYDFRTASRLQRLAAVVAERHPDGVARMGERCRDPELLVATLDALPGWGPVTVGAFLRELRGVWPAVDPPLDARAAEAAARLGLFGGDVSVPALRVLAHRAGLDPRDLEAALVRHALAHFRLGAAPDSP